MSFHCNDQVTSNWSNIYFWSTLTVRTGPKLRGTEFKNWPSAYSMAQNLNLNSLSQSFVIEKSLENLSSKNWMHFWIFSLHQNMPMMTFQSYSLFESIFYLEKWCVLLNRIVHFYSDLVQIIGVHDYTVPRWPYRASKHCGASSAGDTGITATVWAQLTQVTLRYSGPILYR